MKTLLPTDSDWADIAYLNDLLLALNERAQAVGKTLSLPESVEEGVDAHGSSWMSTQLIPDIQNAIESLCVYFVDFTREGSWDGAADTMFTSFSDFKTKTGFDGWRAYTEDPEDGGSAEYRTFDVGDIIREWIWEDIAEATKYLKWTPCYAVIDSSSKEKVPANNYGGTGESLAAAQSGADAAFSVAAEVDLTDVRVHTSAHDYGAYIGPTFPWGWEAQKRSCKALYQIYPYDLIDIHEITPPAGVTLTWDLYVKPNQDTYSSFDAAGLGWTEDAWNKVAASGSSFTGTVTAINYDTPSWGAGEQWSGMVVPNSGVGYSDQPFAILKWVFSDT